MRGRTDPRGNGIEVVHLSKSFGTVRAVEDVSMTVAAGETRGLVGANGAGKTTVISCVSGVLTPDGGRVLVAGTDTRARARGASGALGVVSQRTAVYGSLSVHANLRFFARLVEPRERAIGERIGGIVESLRLGALMHMPVATLSGGQQRLVHIASALVHRPRIVVLDEPTAGLDLSARASVFDLLRELAEEGTAVLLSTHRLDEVEQHCDTVTLLHRGRTIADGGVEAVIGELRR
jgi:ABC-2 type transport system ATP-binding protein